MGGYREFGNDLNEGNYDSMLLNAADGYSLLNQTGKSTSMIVHTQVQIKVPFLVIQRKAGRQSPGMRWLCC